HPMVRKNIIIGRAFKNKEEIEAVADKRTQFIKAPDDSGMRAVMMESDIAISSGGQTLYELARTGVPTAAVIVADNQEDSVKAWADSAFCTNAGYWTEDELIDNIAEAIEKLKNTEYREQKSQLGQTLVPGNGGLRIVDYIEKRVKEVT
ncbi:MAG: UDP-2,4-diacetamido-2,4,6-trideoxy-beta-L-altropyranose hydrolase, partial [bacterium]|nr:UDP-2,4-diacetamido-2,4,6-trideoxy-beta-L-altropyranose hydrolase [bacterium]